MHDARSMIQDKNTKS